MSARTSSRRPPPRAAALTGHVEGRQWGPVAWPVCAVPAALLVFLTLHVVDAVPRYGPAGVAAVLAATHWWVATRLGSRPGLRWYYATHWLAPAVWGTVVYAAGWGSSWHPWVALGALFGVSVLVAELLGPKTEDPVETNEARPAPAKPRDVGDQVVDLINSKFQGLNATNRFTRAGMTMWPERAGFRLTVKFPERQRVTLGKVVPLADELGTDLKLPNGCTVRIAAGPTKDIADIDVELVDRLVDDRPFPAGYRPRSIRDDFPLGFVTSGAEAHINLGQASAMFTAQRGGGKTVLLHNAIANLVLCRDALVMVIDINGGGIAVPWLRPYALGLVDRPAIDWVATTPQQALAMGRTLIAVAKDRKSAYASLLAETNVDVLPVTPKIPAVIVVVDEGHTVFGMDATKRGKLVGAVLAELQKIARAMCVNLILTTQRSTSDYVPSTVKSQTTIGAVGPVLSDAEIAFLLDWNHGLSVRDLTGPGQFFLRNGPSDTPRRMKTYQLLPQQISDIAVAAAKLRPELDERGRRVAGRVYEERWDTLRPWLERIAGRGGDDPIVTDEDGDDEDGTGVGFGPSAAPAMAAATLAANMTAQIRTQLAALRGEPAPVQVVVDEGDGSEGRRLMQTLLATAGPAGMRTGDLYEKAKAAGLVGERRQTVNDWLKLLADQGRVAPSGDYATWVSVEHVPAGAGQAA
jgi:S-DNA-T family DNA segregation ATPase FtsK/SpoIIIE